MRFSHVYQQIGSGKYHFILIQEDLSLLHSALVPRNLWRSLFLFCGVMLAIAIGWTRLYLGVHYPSDILGRWTLVISWAMSVSWLSRVNAKL